MSLWIDEGAFIAALTARLNGWKHRYAAVTGPGRSGAIAAAYASYISGRPFVPFGQPHPGPILIIDTATMSGRTIRKARNKYKNKGIKAHAIAIYASPITRYHFWYERPVDKAVDRRAFDYDWSVGAIDFWWRFFPWHGPPPRPTTGCGCLWWTFWITVSVIIAAVLL